MAPSANASRPARVLLFADPTVSPIPCLRQLSKDAKRCVSLEAFLRITASSLRSEISRSASPVKHTYPTFSTIIELVEWYSALPRPEIVVYPVLLCIAQLGTLIREYALNPVILDASQDSPLYPIGLCNGQLAAAAATLCRSAADLLNVGPRLVCLNARLMFALVERSRSIDPTDGDWTILTSALTTEDHEHLLKSFLSTQEILPTALRPYISAQSGAATTISGPPRILSAYFASDEKLVKAKKFTTVINTACHAPHLWTPDLQDVLGEDPIWSSYPIRDHVKMLSINSGAVISADDSRSLLLTCLDEVFNKRFRWDSLLNGVCQDVSRSSMHAKVFAVGPDRVATAVSNALSKAGVSAQVVDETALPETNLSSHNEDIAVVGVSSRLPGANNLDEVWQLLKDGRDVHGRIPPDRFDLNDHLDPTGHRPNTVSVPFGCFLKEPGAFDAKMFNMSPREAKQTDPMQRLALLTTYEALEMAGYAPNALPSYKSERIGTFWGQTVDDYRETNACQDVDIYYVSGGVRAFAPGRLNYHFKWEGPSMSVDTACSSSALAIQLAYQSLRSGECDMAIAGGANVITGPDMYAGLCRGGFLSTTGQCKTFDNDADGYCRGEGVGSVVLKRLRDAQADGDNILAVIKSCATNHSAYAESITRPHSGAQIKVMKKILQEAGLRPSDLDYVEMHGTGTQAGDTAEFTSVASLLSQDRAKDRPLHIGSIKANVGHGEAAAGINSFVKILLMLRYGEIPPNVGIKGKINSGFPKSGLEAININRSRVPFARQGNKVRNLLLNSFNASGGNTAMIISDAPAAQKRTGGRQGAHVVVLSGATQKSFEGNRESLVTFLKANPKTQVADLAYTSTARRMHHSFRNAYLAGNVSELVQILAEDIKFSKAPCQRPSEQKIVFAFTGQGSHTLETARQLYQTHGIFRHKLEQYQHICRNQKLPHFLDIIQGSASQNPPVAAFQLSIVAVQLALIAALRSWRITPTAVIGHSIGEYAALAAAGVLSELDTLLLAGKRALLIEELCQVDEYSMLSLATELKDIQQAISGLQLDQCVVACQNGQSLFVVSGPHGDLSRLAEYFQKRQIPAKLVGVNFGFHSDQMKPVAERLQEIAAKINFNKPQIPVASTLLGQIVNEEGVFNGAYLAKQTLQPVRYSDALQALSQSLGKSDDTLFLELGTHPVCGPIIVQNLRVSAKRVLYLLKKNEDHQQSISKVLAKSFEAGISIDWTEYHREHRQDLSLLELPNYAFELKNYWIPYKNSWRLHKGNEMLAAPAPVTIDPSLRPFHRLQSGQVSKTEAMAVLECDLTDPEIATMITGHLVEGVPLCSSSVYAHMAHHAAAHVLRKRLTHCGDLPPLDLTKMNIILPLSLSPDSPPNSPLNVAAMWKASEPGIVQVSFTTVTETGERSHCQCTVTIHDTSSWHAETSELSHLVQSQIDLLQESSKRVVETMHRRMIYNIFASAIVKYSEEYQLIQRISIDYERNEASAQLQLPQKLVFENGSPGPFSLDAFMHMAGFVLNSNPQYPIGTAFIASGWDNFRFVEPLVAGRSYTVYSRMLSNDNDPNLFVGNVNILSGSKIIGICRGLRFHRLRRTSLQKMLGSPGAPGARALGPKTVPPSAPLKKPVSLPPARKAMSEAAPAEHVTAGMDSWNGILQDMAEETSVPVADLTSQTRLSELGIDSLLTISLLKRFKQRIGTDFPANTFHVCTTIGEMKRFLKDKIQMSEPETSKPVKPSSKPTSKRKGSDDPLTEPKKPRLSETSNAKFNKSSSKFETLCAIICAETGMEGNEIKNAKTVSELGIDSLLTISIGKEYKAQTGEELGVRFFYDNASMESVAQKLDGASVVVDVDIDSDSTQEADLSSEDSEATVDTPLDSMDVSELPDLSKYDCVSMLLQGTPKDDEPALFLLPDGSGSLFSYIHLPMSKPDMAVYALDSPFHKNPEDYDLSFAAVAEIYTREIRSLQPHGPYMIGGWSLGGVHAYEVTRQILEAGETVDRLIMIDSPCPGTLPPLPHASLDLLEKAGIFKGLSQSVGQVADHTRQHFVRVTDSFQHWNHRPLTDDERSRLGSASIIWAQHGVLEDDDDARNAWVPGMDKVDVDMLKAKEWLTGKRKSFGAEGWDKLVRKEIDCYKVPGNHFSMMFPPVVQHVADVLKKII